MELNQGTGRSLTLTGTLEFWVSIDSIRVDDQDSKDVQLRSDMLHIICSILYALFEGVPIDLSILANYEKRLLNRATWYNLSLL